MHRCRVWPQLGGHPVVGPYLKPLGQDHEPAGAELDGVTDARGAAVGTQRTGGAIAAPVVIPNLLDTGIYCVLDLVMT